MLYTQSLLHAAVAVACCCCCGCCSACSVLGQWLPAAPPATLPTSKALLGFRPPPHPTPPGCFRTHISVQRAEKGVWASGAQPPSAPSPWKPRLLSPKPWIPLAPRPPTPHAPKTLNNAPSTTKTLGSPPKTLKRLTSWRRILSDSPTKGQASSAFSFVTCCTCCGSSMTRQSSRQADRRVRNTGGSQRRASGKE